MKFVLAPDKFKGSLSGMQFCAAVEKAILSVMPQAEIISKPLADGGDGTLEVVQHYLQAREIEVQVNDPLFRKIKSRYLLSADNKIAFIEMSEASGYKLLEQSELNCMGTTSLGTGELIMNALNKGVEEIVLGIGGSATNDGGIGVAKALGYRFLDIKGKELEPVGKHLNQVSEIDASQADLRLKRVSIKVACDVNNPLFGQDGAAYIYGSQKGANEDEIAQLDLGLQNLAKIIQQTFGINVQEIPGAGAAGGLGAGAIVFLGGILESGAQLVAEMAGLEQAIQGADWVITGEGQLDEQTLSGKTIDHVLKTAKKCNIPVAAFCGAMQLSIAAQKRMGLTYATSILNHVGDLESAKLKSNSNLMNTAYNFASIVAHYLK